MKLVKKGKPKRKKISTPKEKLWIIETKKQTLVVTRFKSGKRKGRVKKVLKRIPFKEPKPPKVPFEPIVSEIDRQNDSSFVRRLESQSERIKRGYVWALEKFKDHDSMSRSKLFNAIGQETDMSGIFEGYVKAKIGIESNWSNLINLKKLRQQEFGKAHQQPSESVSDFMVRKGLAKRTKKGLLSWL